MSTEIVNVELSQKKPIRGGARPGAGRKKNPPELTTKKVQFRLREHEIPLMKAYFKSLRNTPGTRI